MAAWAPCTIYDQGQKYDLARGELVASLRSISDLFGWSRSKVDRFLKRLEEGQRISRCVSTKGRKSQTIRLLNYESFYGQNDTTETVPSTLTGQNRDSLKKEESNKLKESKHYGVASSSSLAPSLDMADLQKIADHCLKISNLESVAKFAPGFHDLSPIAAWLKAGADPEEDLYPLIQMKAKASIRSWAYFTPAIMEALARRSYLTPQTPKEPVDEGSFITTDNPASTQSTPNPARNPAAARTGRPGSAHALMLAGAMAEAERSQGGG